jgi:hypothetical protein
MPFLKTHNRAIRDHGDRIIFAMPQIRAALQYCDKPVMAGLPRLYCLWKGVDAWHKAGHDEAEIESI